MTETLTTTSMAEYGADALIVCDNLVRIYQVENIEVQALQGLDLLVNKGEMIAIVGQSGSGKSTLLNVLSGLDVPTAGAAKVAGWDLLRMTHADRLNYRRSVVGFVWQQTARNLLPYLSARENVMLPMAFSGLGGSKRIKHANELLDAMGMGAMASRRPSQLSGGEQQRVAIAVALANSPEVIFADEPTGELDSATGDDVFEALRSANQHLGATVVVVTHDHAVSSQVQRTVAIRDGRTATEVVRRTHIDDQGQTQTTHEEYAVLDRAGRMQLPKDYRAALGLKDRVRLELEDDHLGVWADGAPRKPKHTTAAPKADAPRPPASAPAPEAIAEPLPEQSPEPNYAPPVAPVAPPARKGVTFTEPAPRPTPQEQAGTRRGMREPLPDPLGLNDQAGAPYQPRVQPPALKRSPYLPEPPAAPPRSQTPPPTEPPARATDEPEPRMPWLPVKESDNE